MEDLSRGLQSQLRDARATILDLQTRLLESESALGVAEQAAARAAQEMADLHQVGWAGWVGGRLVGWSRSWLGR